VPTSSSESRIDDTTIRVQLPAYYPRVPAPVPQHLDALDTIIQELSKFERQALGHHDIVLDGRLETLLEDIESGQYTSATDGSAEPIGTSSWVIRGRSGVIIKGHSLVPNYYRGPDSTRAELMGLVGKQVALKVLHRLALPRQPTTRPTRTFVDTTSAIDKVTKHIQREAGFHSSGDYDLVSEYQRPIGTTTASESD